MRIHDEDSARQYERIAADALEAVKIARVAVAEAKRTPPPAPAPHISDQAKRAIAEKFAPRPPEPPQQGNPFNPFAGIAAAWQRRGKGLVTVDSGSVPTGDALPAGAPVYDLRQTGGDFDQDAITAPAIEAARVERARKVREVWEAGAPERARIEAVKEEQEAAARATWGSRA